jgi:hypothetical protein
MKLDYLMNTVVFQNTSRGNVKSGMKEKKLTEDEC